MQSIGDFLIQRARASRAAFARKGLAHGYAVALPDIDADEMRVEAGEESQAPIGLHITYCDSRGAVSSRFVTLRRIEAVAGDLRIYALCHSREAIRMFLASRIRTVADGLTGEVHEDTFNFFRSHPLIADVEGEGQFGASAAAVRECADEATVLMFLAGCDNSLVEPEIDQVVLHVMNAVPDPDVQESEVRDLVLRLVADEAAYNAAMKRLARSRLAAARVWRSVRKVVDADGHIRPEEAAFAQDIYERFGRTGIL